MKTQSRRSFIVWLLIAITAFLGFSAVVSGAMLMIAPDGSLMGMPVSTMQGAPFKDFFVPGLILFLLLGVYPTLAACSLWKQPAWRWPDAINPFKAYHWSWAGVLAVAAILWIWLAVEMVWVDYPSLQIACFIWGGIILLLALLPPVRRYLKLHS